MDSKDIWQWKADDFIYNNWPSSDYEDPTDDAFVYIHGVFIQHQEQNNNVKYYAILQKNQQILTMHGQHLSSMTTILNHYGL